MTDYLQTNSRYWDGRYQASNVESFIFRFYGRILKFDYGIDGSKHERILDFGCGEGGALSYFDKLGFDCLGVDIARNDVKAAQAEFICHLASHQCCHWTNPEFTGLDWMDWTGLNWIG